MSVPAAELEPVDHVEGQLQLPLRADVVPDAELRDGDQDDARWS
ncbi:hypothetical protein [Blastococcus sp. TF02A-26]|nr:hypothetical protein [Blastococcus sp. TF02A-26]